MASLKSKKVDDRIHEYPKKIVVVAGPSFGTVSSYMLLGAAIGAAGVLYLKSRQGSPSSNAASKPSHSADTSSALTMRTNALMERVKSLSVRARDTIESAKETLAPKFQEAISEAKIVAANTEQQLKIELKEEREKEEKAPETE